MRTNSDLLKIMVSAIMPLNFIGGINPPAHNNKNNKANLFKTMLRDYHKNNETLHFD